MKIGDSIELVLWRKRNVLDLFSLAQGQGTFNSVVQ